jgi:hypothetical protein
MAYNYPDSDLNKPQLLLSLLGSFWSDTYDGASDVQAFAAARAQLEAQTVQNFREAVDATSREKVPVFHTQLWHQLILKESEMNGIDFSIPKYGEGFVYGAQPTTDITILYGRPTNRDVFAFPAPQGIVKAPSLFNRTDLPSVSWFVGLDYVLEDDYIKFNQNPFEVAELPIRDVIEGAEVVDREIALWLFMSEWDLDIVWTHYGHIQGIKLPSSPHTKV